MSKKQVPDEEEVFDAYITKYVLTKGILKKKVKRSSNYPNMISPVGNSLEHYHGEGRDWHQTYLAALSRAEEMRLNKLKSLNKQITKISALKFKEP